jgi:uncharacterized membrane protein (DUF106 family)
MTQIDINPILLLVATALVSGFTLLSQYFFEAWKKNKESQEKIINEELQARLKNKEIFDKLEQLNQDEDKYKESENLRMMANNMSVLTNQTECSKIITGVILRGDVKRFILFHTHNGNGQPNNLKPFKVSYLQYNAVDTSEIGNYQNLEVDNPYAKMLIEIQNSDKHYICFSVEDMENCLLKTIYTKENMKYVEVYFLCATNTGIIYTSLATCEIDSTFENSRLEIIYAISKLKHIFEGERSRVFRDGIEREENEMRLKQIYFEKIKIKNEL